MGRKATANGETRDMFIFDFLSVCGVEICIILIIILSGESGVKVYLSNTDAQNEG